MKFYILDPEVAGELGKNTVMDNSVHPPKVSRLHYELDAWLGDDLIQSFPCYLVSEKLKRKISASSLSGAAFDSVEFSLSPNFKERHPSKFVPDFAWFKITGSVGKDDFGVEADGRIVVSERALTLIQQLNLSHCEISSR
jgi:hypothetical protein